MTRSSSVDARRAEIIAATVRVLAHDGIAGTTTRKIAAEAEVNLATLGPFHEQIKLLPGGRLTA